MRTEPQKRRPITRFLNLSCGLLCLAAAFAVVLNSVLMIGIEGAHKDTLITHLVLTGIALLGTNSLLSAANLWNFDVSYSARAMAGTLLTILVVYFPLCVLAFTNIFLAINGIEDLTTAPGWVFAFLIPGIVGLWGVIVSMDLNKKREQEPEEACADEAGEPDARVLDYSQILLRSGLIGLFFGLIILLIGIGSIYFLVVERALTEGLFVGWGNIGPILAIAWNATGPTALHLGLLIWGIYCVLGIVVRLLAKRGKPK